MRFETLCKYALKEGANSTVTGYHRTLTARIEAIERARQNPNSVESVALAAGVHNFGGALHQTNFNARRAAALCKGIERPLPIPSQQALSWLVGSALINYAFHTLPPVAKAAAYGWKRLSAQEQLKVLTSVASELRSLSIDILEPRGHMERYRPLRQMFLRRKTREFLPAKFVELGIDEQRSCLGMSMLLAAFAAVARVKFLWVTPSLMRDTVHCDVKRENLRKVFEEYRRSGYRDRNLYSTMKKTVEHLDMADIAISDWHHAIVIQLSDGRWVLFDPYMSATVVLTRTSSQIDKIYRLIMQYRFLMPGLAMQLQDLDYSLQFATNVKLNTENILDAAVLFRAERERDEHRTIESLVQSLPMKILAWASYFEHYKMEFSETPPLRVENLSSWWKPRDAHPAKIDPVKDEQRYRESAEFRRECLGRLEVKFFELAASDIDQIRSHWGIAHPAMDLQGPATGIGLATLTNLLSLDPKLTPTADLATLLVSHTNAQMLWHEAAVALEGQNLKRRQQQVMDDARAAIGSLPVQHPLTRIQLQQSEA